VFGDKHPPADFCFLRSAEIEGGAKGAGCVVCVLVLVVKLIGGCLGWRVVIGGGGGRGRHQRR